MKQNSGATEILNNCLLILKSYKQPRILGKSLFCQQEPPISRLQTKKVFVIRCCEPSAEPISSR